LTLVGCASVQPRGNSNDSASVRSQQNESDIGAILNELRALRQQAADAERSRATQKEPGGPPVWSNWALATIALVAGWIAYNQFRHQRDAVHLTQRADVLIDALRLGPYETGPNVPLGPSSISVILKNFGPTRASEFALTGIQVTIGDQSRPMAVDPLRPTVIAGMQPYEFGFGPLNQWFDRTLIATVGKTNDLTFSFEYRFTDIFGTVTEAQCKARFLPDMEERFEVNYQEQRHKAKKRQKAHS
jgi:hypothetical protein